ncbi:fatty acid synthase alpha subunit Lsd1 [Coemansia sp. S100]|nr:fatty acid synthase alpha subunit Lsd1 [Coemansia sp. S100]
MSRVLGAPTVMVAGMTPTTVNEGFVAAINNAGYYAELAGGGIFTENDFECKIDSLVKQVRPGQGITLNCIYMNQRMWSFQFPALLRLRSNGVPIAGLCIGGGVPSLDSTKSIIDSLRSIDIRHVAFKPWTGGRAGGHHSFENFHQPVLETYAAIRACRNIVLVAGSGFGDAEGSLPYLTGDWSTLFDRVPMPFDGILLGSRVMVAKEAGTSLAAKELIVAASGLSDAEWHHTYGGPSGGVMTVTSEYGELNHVLATKAMVFVNDLRSTILIQPRENHAALLIARKDEIIARLNSDYFRPWFGRKADGRVVDLEEMTYGEVISRLVKLMYAKHQQRWIHKSYRRVVLDFIARAERRLGMDLPEMSFVPELRDVPPAELAQFFTDKYPAAESQLLCSEDIQFFVGICKRHGHKPVPFIVALDAEFAIALVKDSFWQSENLDVILDQDPQRVAIQQGPVAARYSTIVNEPVKDILDGVYHGHIAALLSRDYDGDAANVPVVEYIGAQPGAAALPANLVGGKSTLQNEIVGDLHKEFCGQVPDMVEELSLKDLASAIGAFGGRLGKHTLAQLARLFGNKMPGGFSLSQIMDWVRSVKTRYVGMDLREGARLAESEQSRSAEMQTRLNSISTELGEKFIDGLQPLFDPRKARHFDSCWNWVRQEAYELIQQAIASCASESTNAPAIVDDASLQRLKNRSSPGLLQMLVGSLSILQAANDDSLEPVIKLVSELHDVCTHSLTMPPAYRELSTPTAPQVDIGFDGTVTYSEVQRPDEPSLAAFIEHMRQPTSLNTLPLLHLRKQLSDYAWSYCPELSEIYYEVLSKVCDSGLSFAGKTALVTGCGRGSIGADIVCSLLSGGAKVIVTTSSYSRKTTLFFEDVYRTYGACGSELIVVPFNQGSTGDIKQLVDYIYSDSGVAKGLGWDLNYVFPFAVVSDIGSFATNLGLHSEFALRVELTNVMRLLGSIKDTKERLGYNTQSSLVILPLSTNCGNFGGDGLYSECKMGLMTIFNRWNFESWQDYLSIAGAVIGWTRGTNLMTVNNLVSPRMEQLGVRTFTTREMAFCILGLVHPRICRLARHYPVWTDLDGGMRYVVSLNTIMINARAAIQRKSRLIQVLLREAAFDYTTMVLRGHSKTDATADERPLAKHKHHFPAPRHYDQLEHLRHLQGMVNLDKVVVITGYGEVSPHGNAETRWEMEAYGEFSLEGCIELAWIMGLIKHSNGTLKSTGARYVGWLDAKTEKPIRDIDIKPSYEEYILAHTGIRLIEPELAHGYDPNKRTILREIQIEHDMEPFEATADEAATFKAQNGSNVDIWENSSGGSWSVKFLKGALIRVPMALRGDRMVAALVPTGWDPGCYGIPDDVIKQVDQVTCFALVATVEALVRSGITDPYELYQYFHVSEIGNTTGSGFGGSVSMQDVFRSRHLDKEVKNDALQETFVSTIQAWTNMLLMSSSGPVKPVVGACATAVLAIDAAVETIQSGKAKVMIAGSADNFTEETSIEFANMGATSNSVEEFAQGRTPSEMCRPCTSTRNGFMEGQGAGIVTLMSASAAIEFGAPIYGIIAMSGTATDKQGLSVPAPGKGVLTSAREASDNSLPSRLLNFDYRRRQLQHQLAALETWKQGELADMADMVEPSTMRYAREVEKSYQRQRRSLQDAWGNEFWKSDPEFSPLRGSLAVWGLTADDIGLASFHGTSTVANDKNESDVLNTQLKHLGRTPGHVVPVVCQRWLTGHPKGPAASFMLNGVIQSLRTGLIPRNRNADNIGKELEANDYALYLSKSIQISGVKAGLIKSFGFGQVGGELLVVHPDYLLATLTQEQLDKYNVKLQQRDAKSERYWQDTLVGNYPFVQVKSNSPFTTEQEKSVYLNPLARAKYDPKSGEYKFKVNTFNKR